MEASRDVLPVSGQRTENKTARLARFNAAEAMHPLVVEILRAAYSMLESGYRSDADKVTLGQIINPAEKLLME